MSIEEDDDKAIKIDEDEDDSDNDKFEEIFQYQKKSNNRPESKRGRPESANTEKITQNGLEKFNQYITKNQIQIEDFWKSNKIFAEPNEFAKFSEDVGFTCSNQEYEQLVYELQTDGNILIETLCKKVDQWNNNESNQNHISYLIYFKKDAMFEFIRERALKLAQGSKRKFSAQVKKSKPQSASAARPVSSKVGGTDFRPISGISVKSKYSALTDFKISSGPEKPVQNMSKYYLQKAKEKEKEMDRLLQLTINKGKNEYEYEMLIKMGEANELSQLLNSKITYRAYKSAVRMQGNLKVHIYDLDKFVKDMTLEEFQREYNMIKNKYNETRNLKVWEVLSESKKNTKSAQQFSKGEVANKEEQEDERKKEKVINKKERQQELKRVLLETMMLTNVLKEQLSVLNKKGITQQLQQQPMKQ